MRNTNTVIKYRQLIARSLSIKVELHEREDGYPPSSQLL